MMLGSSSSAAPVVACQSRKEVGVLLWASEDVSNIMTDGMINATILERSMIYGTII